MRLKQGTEGGGREQESERVRPHSSPRKGLGHPGVSGAVWMALGAHFPSSDHTSMSSLIKLA